jgi:Spy/CpxP family protein refolding chaperone
MKSFKMTTLLSTLLFALPFAVIADEHGGGQGGHGGAHMERMAEHLDLSEEQRQRMEAIHETNHPRMEELRSQMHEKKETIREAAMTGDDAAAQAAADELGELASEAALLKANTMATVHGLLNEEQRERFEEMHERHGEGRGHHGRGRGHHGNEEGRGRGNRDH